MSNVILAPALRESIVPGGQACIEEWRVTEGNPVHAGPSLARANLPGACVEVPASHSGAPEQIVVPAGSRFAGERLATGAVLARVVPT